MDGTSIGNRLAELYQQGKFDDIYSELYSPDVVSIEAGPDRKEYAGMEAIHGKNQWWFENFETHSSGSEGPFPNGDDFCMIYTMDVTEKASGHRFQMKEVAHYKTANGKVIEEKFYYSM